MRKTTLVSILIILVFPIGSAATEINVPASIDHQPWDELLMKYVDDQGLVDYGRWKNSDNDSAKLNTYLFQFTPKSEKTASGSELIASLVNAYNALTISYILENYPSQSIRNLYRPFKGKRHLIGGEKVSLDDIEHTILRPLIGWKAHAILVCAARSCPPLLNRAYFSGDWEEKMEGRYNFWLARNDLNAFIPKIKEIRLSKIFDWYGEDFNGNYDVASILIRFGPNAHSQFIASGHYEIVFMDYHWGINDQSGMGRNYKNSFWKGLF